MKIFENNKKLKAKIIDLATDSGFKHYKWYVKYHLQIVEKIALYLCNFYKNADVNLVYSLLWVHDISKIVSSSFEVPRDEIRKLMSELGFDNPYIDKVIKYLELHEMKETIDLRETPIEVQIVSSADGGSHFIGPFMSIYLYENPTKDLEELMQSNLKKANKDWDRKIILPEARELLKDRYRFVVESNSQSFQID